jgi:putative flippase GtrA
LWLKLKLYNFIVRMIKHLFLPARFLISGSIGAVVNLGLLFSLTSWLELWYLASAVIAFIVAMFASFTLQKFWTFRDNNLDRVSNQFRFFVSIAVFNLGLNTLLMYLFVDGTGLHYLLAQVFAGGLIAIWSFLLTPTLSLAL